MGMMPAGDHMTVRIGRRPFILACGTAVAWPLSLRAQQGKRMQRIGVLLFGTPDTDPNLGAFLRGLRDLGYTESQNIVIEYRYAEGKPDRLRSLAGELVAIKPDLIFALGGDVAPSARVATGTIPIVIAVSNDPVQSGLVASLARPGGNITGVTFVSSDLAAKRLQFLREIAPNLARVAVIWNPDHVDPEYRETQTAAKTLGIQLQSLEVRSAEDFDTAFQIATDARIEALIPITSRLMLTNRPRIIEFSRQHQLLLASGFGPWVREGALLSYGPDTDASTKRAAIYVDKILHGAKPDELPIEQPTKFQLLVNGKTAKSLGLDIPPTLLATADQVIE
jgi:putative ABC transport system substrate-binding protein